MIIDVVRSVELAELRRSSQVLGRKWIPLPDRIVFTNMTLKRLPFFKKSITFESS